MKHTNRPTNQQTGNQPTDQHTNTPTTNHTAIHQTNPSRKQQPGNRPKQTTPQFFLYRFTQPALACQQYQNYFEFFAGGT
jgi:hypothetical protein